MTTKEKTRESTRKRSDVAYTQPKPFQRRRFVLHIATVVAVVLALVFGMAIFFKVKEVKVSGADKYSAWEISKASGIDGDNLLTLNKAKISSKIITELPYIKSVRISITLPDTVNIQVEELTVFYSVQASDESWWLMAADGKVLEKITEADAANHTKIVGIRITDPKAGYTAVAEEAAPQETQPGGETVPVTVYGREKLQAATSVLTALEQNGIMDVFSVLDVSDVYAITLQRVQRGVQFRVNVGDTAELDRKIPALKAYLEEHGKDNSVVLDISSTNITEKTWREE